MSWRHLWLCMLKLSAPAGHKPEDWRLPGVRAVFDVSGLLQVGDALLDVIFDPDVADGAGLVIDGFPRTALQVTQLIPAPIHRL